MVHCDVILMLGWGKMVPDRVKAGDAKLVSWSFKVRLDKLKLSLNMAPTGC